MGLLLKGLDKGQGVELPPPLFLQANQQSLSAAFDCFCRVFWSCFFNAATLPCWLVILIMAAISFQICQREYPLGLSSPVLEYAIPIDSEISSQVFSISVFGWIA